VLEIGSRRRRQPAPPGVLWRHRPDARVRFDVLPEAGGQETNLRWTLYVAEPDAGADV